MSKSSIYLALPPDLNGPWAYMDAASLDGANGSVQWAKTEAQKMALSAKELTLILPGENIIRRAIDLPGIRGRELKSAIEFDLEDRIGGSMSDEFMCMDRKRPGHVALLSNNYKMQLSTLLEKYELNPERIYIDFELKLADSCCVGFWLIFQFESTSYWVIISCGKANAQLCSHCRALCLLV